MKKLIILAILIIVIILLFTFGFSKPPEETVRATISGNAINDNTNAIVSDDDRVEIDIVNSLFEFEGFGPGKSHVGTFNELKGELLVDEGRIVGMQGTVKVNSVDTGINRLDEHLKSDDFFDVEKYPEISFVSTSLEDEEMTGDLTFRGVTKELTFPVSTTSNGISADFILDTTDFSFKYVGVNKEVRIGFDLKI